MEKLQNVEELFSSAKGFDKKHKTNVNEGMEIAPSLLKSIEKDGIISEQINELSKDGFSIFRYMTQITLHGIAKDLNIYKSYYRCLILNKNKSIGIKYIAIDRAKKEAIFKIMKYFEWSIENNSTSYCMYKMVECKSKTDALLKAKEWGELYSQRLKKVNYIGSIKSSIGELYGNYYALCQISIMAIYQINCNDFIESLLNMKMSEIVNFMNEVDAKKKAEYEAWEEKQREEKEKAEKEIKAFINDNNLIEIPSCDIKEGEIFYYIDRYNVITKFIREKDHNKKLNETSFYERCDDFFKQKNINVYIKSK